MLPPHKPFRSRPSKSAATKASYLGQPAANRIKPDRIVLREPLQIVDRPAAPPMKSLKSPAVLAMARPSSRPAAKAPPPEPAPAPAPARSPAGKTWSWRHDPPPIKGTLLVLDKAAAAARRPALRAVPEQSLPERARQQLRRQRKAVVADAPPVARPVALYGPVMADGPDTSGAAHVFDRKTAPFGRLGNAPARAALKQPLLVLPAAAACPAEVLAQTMPEPRVGSPDVAAPAARLPDVGLQVEQRVEPPPATAGNEPPPATAGNEPQPAAPAEQVAQPQPVVAGPPEATAAAPTAKPASVMARLPFGLGRIFRQREARS